MRNFKSASANALFYSSILTSGLLLVNGATVTTAYAVPCTATTRIDGANGTACLGGTSFATLVYVADNPAGGGTYVAGDFTLFLSNHDVTAAAGNGITFSGTVVGDGFITLQDDSDVISGAGGDGINASSDAAGEDLVRASATGRVWEVFDNDNEVDVAGISVSDDDLEGTYGEVAGQVDVDLSTSLLLFVRGSVLFSDDVTKPAVHGGFNWSW